VCGDGELHGLNRRDTKRMGKKVTTFFLKMIVEPQVRKFCGPLFFVSSQTTPKGNINGSASFGLVDTGQKKLLVTCWHVLFGEGGFKETHSVNPAFQFGIGFGGTKPVSISYEDLMEKKVDDERRCDLVTFDVSDALDLVLMFSSISTSPKSGNSPSTCAMCSRILCPMRNAHL
jgi:hypothetical protein